MWLSILNPARWIMLGGITILSAIASAILLKDNGLVGPHWKIIAAACSLAATIFSGLHTVLHCDEHQTECRRLISAYSSLEIGFQNIQRLEPADSKIKGDELETKYEETVAGAQASAPTLFRTRAEKELAP